MGGSSGQVLSGPDAKGKLSIKVCLHALQMHHNVDSDLKPIRYHNVYRSTRSNGEANKLLT